IITGASPAGYDGAQVTVSVLDSCGNTDVIGTVTTASGVATFSGVGPNFYTISPGLSISAHMDASGLTPAKTSPADTVATLINVLPVVRNNSLSADGFQGCRL